MPDASGQSAGLSVAISIPQSATAATVLQLSDVFLWGVDLAASVRRRLGRTNTFYPQLRVRSVSGSIGVKGETNFAKPPVPQVWAGLAADLTITAVATTDGTRSVTFPVKITALSFKRSEKNQTKWSVETGVEIVGAPTWSAGWGDLLNPSAPTPANEEQWAGTEKIYDPQGLQSLFPRLIDFWGTLGNTDADEETLIVTTISSSTPFTTPHNAKLRRRSFARDALNGGTIKELWGLTTTAEDVINGASVTIDDAGLLQRRAVTAAFGTPPVTPTAGLVARTKSTKEYNDSKILQVQEYGERTTAEDITFPGTPTITDKSTIVTQSHRSQTQVTALATEPAFTPGGSLKTRTWTKQQLTDAGIYMHRHDAGLTTPQEDIENQSSSIYLDPSGLGSQEVHGKIVATASTADPDGVPSGLLLYGTQTSEINDAAFHRRYTYRILTKELEIEHNGTSSISTVAMPATTGIITTETILDTCASTDDAQELALAAMTTYRNVAGFESIFTRKRNTTHFDLILRKLADNKMLVCGQPTARMERLALDGYARTSIKLQEVVSLVSGGSPVNDVLIGYFNWTVAYQTVVLYRRASVTNLTNILSLSARGYTNNASFLSYAQGTLMFQGTIIPKANWLNEGTATTHGYAFVFAYKSVGHGDDACIPVGRWIRTAYNTGMTPGATPLAANVKSGWAVVAPTQIDFSGFLT